MAEPFRENRGGANICGASTASKGNETRRPSADASGSRRLPRGRPADRVDVRRPTGAGRDHASAARRAAVLARRPRGARERADLVGPGVALRTAGWLSTPGAHARATASPRRSGDPDRGRPRLDRKGDDLDRDRRARRRLVPPRRRHAGRHHDRVRAGRSAPHLVAGRGLHQPRRAHLPPARLRGHLSRRPRAPRRDPCLRDSRRWARALRRGPAVLLSL